MSINLSFFCYDLKEVFDVLNKVLNKTIIIGHKKMKTPPKKFMKSLTKRYFYLVLLVFVLLMTIEILRGIEKEDRDLELKFSCENSYSYFKHSNPEKNFKEAFEKCFEDMNNCYLKKSKYFSILYDEEAMNQCFKRLQTLIVGDQ